MVEVVLLRGESGGGWEPDQETKYAGHFLRYSLSMPAALKALWSSQISASRLLKAGPAQGTAAKLA
jgi:hypothetical protein